MSGALKKRWFKCSRCNTKLYATVITGHMWKSHRAYMMKNRGGRKAATSTGKPVDLGLHAAREPYTKPYSMLEAHRGEKVDGRSTWGRAVKAERKREAALEEVRASLKQKTDRLPEETRLRATYLASEGKALTITVHQGKNYVEISNVTLVEISE